MDAGNPYGTFDLSIQVAARLKWDRPARLLLPAVGALAVVGGIVVYGIWDSLFIASPARYAISILLVAAGAFAASSPWTGFAPRARLITTSRDGVVLSYGRSKRVSYLWSDPNLRIELWDMRSAPGNATPSSSPGFALASPGLPTELRLLWASPGRASNLSPEAFDGILRAAESIGASVTRDRYDAGLGVDVTRLIIGAP